MRNPVAMLRATLARRVFGISAEEIRYTFEDVRSDIRALRSELREEVSKLRAEIDVHHHSEDKPKGAEIPVAEA